MLAFPARVAPGPGPAAAVPAIAALTPAANSAPVPVAAAAAGPVALASAASAAPATPAVAPPSTPAAVVTPSTPAGDAAPSMMAGDAAPSMSAGDAAPSTSAGDAANPPCAADGAHRKARLSSTMTNGLEIRDRHGMTALMRAAACGDTAEALLLLRMGAVADSRTAEYRRALHYAASNGHADLCRLLHDEGGANIEKRDTEGFRAFHMAIAGAHAEAALCLVALGADTQVCVFDGRSAYDLLRALDAPQRARMKAVEAAIRPTPPTCSCALV